MVSTLFAEEFSSESEDCEEKHQEFDSEERKAMLVEKSLLEQPPPVKLGEWEKHTKVREFFKRIFTKIRKKSQE